MIKAANEANIQIYNKSICSDKLSGMGTTVVMCYINNNAAYVINVGDSRLYCKSTNLEQITKDHSYVNELVERGVIKKEDASNHPKKNIITKALGTEPDIEPDIYELKLKSGDNILLCTDGLTNMLSDTEIFNILNSDVLQKRTLNLVDGANKNGGTDNITIILIEV